MGHMEACWYDIIAASGVIALVVQAKDPDAWYFLCSVLES